jgi:predicted nucleotide-binding protein (sugar kinase/HSP70/actin superfamily)
MNINEEVSRLRQQVSKMSDLLDAERATKRLPKNMDFVQVSRSEMRSIAELGGKSPLALDLLMIFTQAMDKQNAVMMSYETMECISKKSRRQLSRAVNILKNDNWIQVIKIGTANAYVLNTAVFWTDKGNKRHLGSFTAKVITTLEEQEKDLRVSPNVKLKRIPLLAGKDERLILGSDELSPPDQKDIDLN